MGLHKLPSLEYYWDDYIFITILLTLFSQKLLFFIIKSISFSRKKSFDFENDAIYNDNDLRHKINFFIEKI